ncbi:hypothetical protein BT67DRAFT_441478 [Trichocladium antarcticum]|uniref:Uncharacterized protein n=1 Tax=Trichocladium antarcticum TaxID=1450529 RepID=A0AAN6UL42_9PEZI|nr:hypothetical protein BT67DRAFT_441478 [Trichocladium antarcticum]
MPLSQFVSTPITNSRVGPSYCTPVDCLLTHLQPTDGYAPPNNYSLQQTPLLVCCNRGAGIRTAGKNKDPGYNGF